MNYLEKSIHWQLQIQLGNKDCREKQGYVSTQSRGFRFKGNCLHCKKKMINYEKQGQEVDVIFKARSETYEELRGKKLKVFLRRVGTGVDGYHRECYVQSMARERNLRVRGPEPGEKWLGEDEDDLMAMLDSIHLIEVERDYLGAMASFDLLAERINSDFFNLL